MKTRIFPCFLIVLLVLLTLSLSGCGTDETTPIVETNDGVDETSVVEETPVEETPEPHNFDDPFEGKALRNPNWRWRNEPDDGDWGVTNHGSLLINAEKNRNLWASDNTHFLYQETRDDIFDVYTEMVADWHDTDSAVCGLVVKSPEDNDWVTLKLWAQEEFWRVQFQGRGRGLGFPDTPWKEWDWVHLNVRMYFRLRKEGNAYTGFYKTAAAQDWKKIGTAHVALTPPLQVGIYAGNASDKGRLTVFYDYFLSW